VILNKTSCVKTPQRDVISVTETASSYTDYVGGHIATLLSV